jgi:hypothetical protein
MTDNDDDLLTDAEYRALTLRWATITTPTEPGTALERTEWERATANRTRAYTDRRAERSTGGSGIGMIPCTLPGHMDTGLNLPGAARTRASRERARTRATTTTTPDDDPHPPDWTVMRPLLTQARAYSRTLRCH